MVNQISPLRGVQLLIDLTVIFFFTTCNCSMRNMILLSTYRRKGLYWASLALCFYTHINFRKYVITRRKYICITHHSAGEDIENKVWFNFNAVKDSTLFQNAWFWQGSENKRHLKSQRSAHTSLPWFYTRVSITFCIKMTMFSRDCIVLCKLDMIISIHTPGAPVSQYITAATVSDHIVKIWYTVSNIGHWPTSILIYFHLFRILEKFSQNHWI